MVDAKKGRNINKNTEVDHKIVEVNAITATELFPARDSRMTFTVTLQPGNFDADVYIRYYDAGTDNIKQGVDVLSRRLSGNDSLFKGHHSMQTDNVYTGAISAISESGTFNILVSES